MAQTNYKVKLLLSFVNSDCDIRFKFMISMKCKVIFHIWTFKITNQANKNIFLFLCWFILVQFMWEKIALQSILGMFINYVGDWIKKVFSCQSNFVDVWHEYHQIWIYSKCFPYYDGDAMNLFSSDIKFYLHFFLRWGKMRWFKFLLSRKYF